MSRKAARITKIMEEERALAEERAMARVRPILVAEFRRMKKICPKLKRVLVGNGTFIIDIDGHDSLNDRLPKSFAKLEAMLEAAYEDMRFSCLDTLDKEDLVDR